MALPGPHADGVPYFQNLFSLNYLFYFCCHILNKKYNHIVDARKIASEKDLPAVSLRIGNEVLRGFHCVSDVTYVEEKMVNDFRVRRRTVGQIPHKCKET